MAIKSYKGMDKDMKCRGFQYEVGGEYETDKAKACETGFHACEMPLDVFNYYAPADSRFFEVEQDGKLSRHDDDSKVASTKLKVGAEIGIPGLVKAQIEYIKERTTNEKVGEDNAALTGGYMAALTGGNRAALTGGDMAALTGGDRAVVYGGENAKVRGGMWSVLAIQEWEGCKIVAVRTAVVDGKNIKPNVWYTLEDGGFVEVE